VSVRRISAFIAIRTLGVLAIAQLVPYSPGRVIADGDVHLYADWAARWSGGYLPYRFFHLEYPPGILPFLKLPAPSQGVYEMEFVALALLADVAILLLLRRRARGNLAAWLWIAAPLALGTVMWTRLDIFVALLLLAAVVSMERRSYAWAGVALAGAALLKLWPLLLVVAFAIAVRERRAAARIVGAASGVLAVVIVPMLLAGAGPGLLWMLRYHSARGLELEAIPALPLHVMRVFGDTLPSGAGYGSMQFVGFAAVVTVAALAMYGSWLLVLAAAARRRLPAAHLLLLMVILTLLTSKVLSPQYMIWAVGAVALVVDDVVDGPRLACWTLLACVSAQAIFPFTFFQVVDAEPSGELTAILHGLVVIAFSAVAIHQLFARRHEDSVALASVEELPRPKLAAAAPAGATAVAS